MSFWSKLLPEKRSSTWHFSRGRIESISPVAYKLFSDDGVPGQFILLRLESLDEVVKNLRDEALAQCGNIERFNAIYDEYFKTTVWQQGTYGCDRRLSLWRASNKGVKALAWIIDFKSPNVPDNRLLKRLFKEISGLQFVEASDWYSYVLNLNWEVFFKSAIGEHDLSCVRPVARGLLRKREIDENMRLHWKRQGIGEVPGAVPERKNRYASIPYEAIAELELNKRHNP